MSLAGILGRPVTNQTGQEIGRLDDIVARWSDGQTYPPVTGLVIRVGRRLAFVPASAIDRIAHAEVLLRSARLDLRDVVRRPGEVLLAKDVLDHQLVDVDGVQVIRAADLYLAEVLGRIRLVGADVSTSTLLRRLGPRRWRPLPTPDRVIDWAAIQPFGEPTDSVDGATQVRLKTTHEGLHRLRPGELADLLEDLRRDERQELLAALSADEAADALEEMQPDDLEQLLRESDPDEAARFLAAMEPDEAVDALRDLPADTRGELLRRMAPTAAGRVARAAGLPRGRGRRHHDLDARRGHDRRHGDRGGRPSGRGAGPRRRPRRGGRGEQGGIAWSATSRCSRSSSTCAPSPDTRISSLLEDEDVVTVRPHASADEVAEQLVEARRLSLVVVDDDGRPIGRILADDVLDALVPTKGRFHFPSS